MFWGWVCYYKINLNLTKTCKNKDSYALFYDGTRQAHAENSRKPNRVGRGGALLRPAGYSDSMKFYGEFAHSCLCECRGRCPHRPGRMHQFYGSLRQIRNFPSGRCGHRPLRTSGKLHPHSPKIPVKTSALCRAEQSPAPTSRVRLSPLFSHRTNFYDRRSRCI